MTVRHGCPAIDEEFLQEPHRHFAQLRREGPAVQVVSPNGLPVWLVTRYADARVALTDPRFSKDYRSFGELLRRKAGGEPPAWLDALQAHMLNLDPPDHTRLRKLVAKVFTARRVAALRPRIEEITEQLLDRMADESEVDLLDAFAFALPMQVICELLGVPAEDRDNFRTWSQGVLEAGDQERARETTMRLAEYLVALIERRRHEPGKDDLITALLEVRDESDRLSEQELISMLFLLLVAGHETTVNLIANCVLALLDHPAQKAALRADPGRVDAVIEETLRYDGPINMATLRHTVEDVELSEGVTIPRDETVIVGLASANRDGERFDAAETFDADNDAQGHLAFGHGIHFCVGAPLARLEGQIAVRRLVERFPDLALAVPRDSLTYRFSGIIRGLETFPVTLRQ
ncbi:cytochrome P450 [Allosaccharopolyspora coralli]|uniref:Cytochrome P450 n=1 Tax=Allosaccharopolyspora coralli TaxID=2665642 RepID=A0A5Q3QAI4_9PSEU|nr:cytochrome P450 [Allosaccharopolyspora coralli]QGK70870.1 cytochrome P450 [Allosaccharopolyspora coralli]